MVVTRNALVDRHTLIEERQSIYLTNLANRLSDMGQLEPAVEAAQEAVALYRELADARPEAFTPALAGNVTWLFFTGIDHARPANRGERCSSWSYHSVVPVIFEGLHLTSLPIANALSGLHADVRNVET